MRKIVKGKYLFNDKTKYWRQKLKYIINWKSNLKFFISLKVLQKVALLND